MSDSENGLAGREEPLPGGAPGGDGRRFDRISARGPGPAGSPGCVVALGVPLVLLGSLFVGVSAFGPDPLSESFVGVIVGGAFALVGLLLVWGGIRGWRARSLPPPEVAIERGGGLRPGGRFAVRVRQPGPVALGSLRLALTCERRYRRQVRARSTATVDDSTLLWERELLAVGARRVAAGGALVEIVEVELPPEVPPSGAATPDGRIRWTLELAVEAGFLRGRRTDFEIVVAPSAG